MTSPFGFTDALTRSIGNALMDSEAKASVMLSRINIFIMFKELDRDKAKLLHQSMCHRLMLIETFAELTKGRNSPLKKLNCLSKASFEFLG